VGVQEAHEYNRAIQVCNTDFYWTLVTSSYCVSYRRLAIKCINVKYEANIISSQHIKIIKSAMTFGMEHGKTRMVWIPNGEKFLKTC